MYASGHRIPEAMATRNQYLINLINRVHAKPKNHIARSIFVENRKNKVEIEAGCVSGCFVSTTTGGATPSSFLVSDNSIS